MLGRELTDTATTAATQQKKAMKPRDTIVKRKAPTTGKGKQQVKKKKSEAKAEEDKDDDGDEENMEDEEEDEEQEVLVGMSVPELKAELRKRGQKVGGRKEELVRRLLNAVRREREWAEEHKRTQELAGNSMPQEAAEAEQMKTEGKEQQEVTGGISTEEARGAADADVGGERREEVEEDRGEGEDDKPQLKKEEQAPPTKRKRTIAIP
jgi:hypothetical protein